MSRHQRPAAVPIDDDLRGIRDGRQEAQKLAEMYREMIPGGCGLFVPLEQVNEALADRRRTLEQQRGPVYAHAFTDGMRGALSDYGVIHPGDLLKWWKEQKTKAH